MMNLPDMNPAPPVPRCRRCGGVLKEVTMLTGFHECSTGMWCWHCRKFNPESRP